MMHYNGDDVNSNYVQAWPKAKSAFWIQDVGPWVQDVGPWFNQGHELFLTEKF